jgi:hypothetical protein
VIVNFGVPVLLPVLSGPPPFHGLRVPLGGRGLVVGRGR